MLGKTKRGNDGFGSTGVQVIKKTKKEDEIQLKTSESEQVTVPVQSIYFILLLFCKLSTNNCSHDHTNSL